MKDGIKDIIGKQITGVVVTERKNSNPRSQVYLVFSDDTSFELYSFQSILGAGGIDKGAPKVNNNGSTIVLEAYSEEKNIMNDDANIMNDIAYFMSQILYFKLNGDIEDLRIYPDGNAEKGTFTLWITYNDGKKKEYRTSSAGELLKISATINKEMNIRNLMKKTIEERQ
jgi:hypothetical protein